MLQLGVTVHWKIYTQNAGFYDLEASLGHLVSSLLHSSGARTRRMSLLWVYCASTVCYVYRPTAMRYRHICSKALRCYLVNTLNIGLHFQLRTRVNFRGSIASCSQQIRGHWVVIVENDYFVLMVTQTCVALTPNSGPAETIDLCMVDAIEMGQLYNNIVAL